MSNVFRFWLTRKNRKGDPVYLDVVCNLPSLEAVHALLNEGKMVLGEQLWTYFTADDEGPCLGIKSSKSLVLGPLGITSVEIPDHRYVRFTEDAAP